MHALRALSEFLKLQNEHSRMSTLVGDLLIKINVYELEIF